MKLYAWNVPYVWGGRGPSADVMCVGVTGYYELEFLKGVAQGAAGGAMERWSDGASADDATSQQTWEIDEEWCLLGCYAVWLL
jgi:hypothetical protein